VKEPARKPALLSIEEDLEFHRQGNCFRSWKRKTRNRGKRYNIFIIKEAKAYIAKNEWRQSIQGIVALL
jgi:hypothetical protein